MKAKIITTVFLLCVFSTLFCNSSASAAERHVRLLHIADTHAQLNTHWEYLPEDPDHLHRMGGYARLKTALDERRASAPGAVFTIDGGDTFQGSGVAAWTKGEALIKPLNQMGIEVAVPGNWDPVYGPDAFKKLYAKMNFKTVCFNFHEKATNKRLFPPSAILEKNGVKVAFVGVTDPTTTERQPPAEVKGLDSTRMQGLRGFVIALKQEQKPDLVVLVDHTGLAPSVQLAHEIPEFDIVLSGHTHERVFKSILVGKTIVVEPGSMGSFMGQLDITIRDGKIADHKYELVYIDEKKYAEDPAMKKLVLEAELPFRAKLDKVVGETKTALMRDDVLESNMDNLIADAVKDKAHTETGFTNGFRFCPPIAPGPITENDLWLMLPLDARIKAGTVSGKHFQNYLENEMELVFAKKPRALSGGWGPRPSGMKVFFEAKNNKGSRIKNVEIGGKKLAESSEYTVGGCERDGEPMDMICRLENVSQAHYAPGTIHEALKEYIAKNSPLNYRREGRVRADDLPDKVWSQYGLLQKMWGIPGDRAGVEIPAVSKDEKKNESNP